MSDLQGFWVEGTLTYRFRVPVSAKDHDHARAIVERREFDPTGSGFDFVFSRADLRDLSDSCAISAEIVTPTDDNNTAGGAGEAAK